MEFLQALEKAKELGLTKEEFLPIYLQEMKQKTANRSHYDLERGMYHQTIDATESASSDTSEPYSLHMWQDRNPQRQHTQTELPQHNETGFEDLKSSLSNLKELLCSQLLNVACENARLNERFLITQQDIQNFLIHIHKNVQLILPNQQNDFSEESGSGILEGLRTELLQKFEDHGAQFRSEIHRAQQEIIAGFSCQNCCREDTNIEQPERHEELLMLQKLQLENSYHKLEMNLQQGQSDLSAIISNMTPFITETFNMIYDFQKIVCAELQLLKNNQQILLTSAVNTASAVATNTNLLNLLSGGMACLQNQNQVQHLNIVDSLSKLHGMLYDIKAAGQTIQNAELYEISCSSQPLKKEDSNHPPHEDSGHRSLSCSKSLQNCFYVPFDSGKDSNGDIVSVICCFHVSDISPILESRKKFSRVKYEDTSGCCLRAGFYFPRVKKANKVLVITLDMCQVSTDVRQPNIFKISTKITMDRMTHTLSGLLSAKMDFSICQGSRKTGGLRFVKLYSVIKDGSFGNLLKMKTLYLTTI